MLTATFTIWVYKKKEMNHMKPYRGHLAHNGKMEHQDLAFAQCLLSLFGPTENSSIWK
jgi:hypothetical protein